MAESTVDDAEIARFAKLAASWWDPSGPSGPLHRLNPTRLSYIRGRLIGQFGRDAEAMRPFAGLTLLDVGCGGGLVSEPMTRMGFAVTGIDAADATLPVARAHAADQGLAIDYRHATVEALAASGQTFDAVLALEIVEHVANPGAFLASLGQLVRPGGTVVMSTLNRTPKSYALAIVGAEYLLRWVPRGTHDWAKFVKPSELAAGARRAGLEPVDLTGMSYDPLAREWSLGKDLAVNYLMTAVRPV